MERVGVPTEVALMLEALYGTHTRSRPEQIRLYSFACILLFSSLFLGYAIWHNLIPLHDWSIVVLLPLSSVMFVPYLYAAGRVRYHITPEVIASIAPFGFFTWIMPTSDIIAIAYDHEKHAIRYLTFVTASGKNRSMACIQSIREALATHIKQRDTPAS